MVHFDAAEIQALAERLADEVGLPAELDIVVDVDETTPLGRAVVTSVDPSCWSSSRGPSRTPSAPPARPGGGRRRPRPAAAAGPRPARPRLRRPARRRRPLPARSRVAWEVYCVGRLARLGHRVQRQRRLYQFRNRHGFTDAADAVFERLWTADGLTWADIAAASDEARAAAPRLACRLRCPGRDRRAAGVDAELRPRCWCRRRGGTDDDPSSVPLTPVRAAGWGGPVLPRRRLPGSPERTVSCFSCCLLQLGPACSACSGRAWRAWPTRRGSRGSAGVAPPGVVPPWPGPPTAAGAFGCRGVAPVLEALVAPGAVPLARAGHVDAELLGRGGHHVLDVAGQLVPRHADPDECDHGQQPPQPGRRRAEPIAPGAGLRRRAARTWARQGGAHRRRRLGRDAPAGRPRS